MQPDQPISAWRKVWRDGFAPIIETEGLLRLRTALETSDPALVQEWTVCPPVYATSPDVEAELACAIGFCGMVRRAGTVITGSTVGEVVDYFDRKCLEVNRLLSEPNACRYFLNFWDENPMDVVRPLVLDEVNRELARRQTGREHAA